MVMVGIPGHIYRYICLQISHGRSPPTVPPLEKLVAISVDVGRHEVALGLIAQHLHKSFRNKKILCNLLWNDVMRYRWFQFVCVFSCIFDTPKIGGKVVSKYVLLAVFYLGKIGAKWFQRCVLPIVDSLNIGARWVSSFCFRCPEIGEMIWHRCLKQMDLDGVIPAHIGGNAVYYWESTPFSEWFFGRYTQQICWLGCSTYGDPLTVLSVIPVVTPE